MFPLASQYGLGWPGALAAILVLPVAALAVWWPQLGRPAGAPPAAASARGRPIWRSALAWQVTLFMGLNSFIYYVMIGWLPSILASSGHSAAQAGSLHGAMQLASALPGLLLAASGPPLIGLLRDSSGGWGLPLALCLALTLLIAVLGTLAGRDARVPDTDRPG